MFRERNDHKICTSALADKYANYECIEKVHNFPNANIVSLKAKILEYAKMDTLKKSMKHLIK